jgi:hypothetical protein
MVFIVVCSDPVHGLHATRVLAVGREMKPLVSSAG